MASDLPGGQSLNHAWLRALRPLLWWFLVVLVILGVLWHRHAMEKTQLNYTVVLAGRLLLTDDEASLDGQPAASGQRLSLGKHTLTITHPKAATFTTNFFGWYGGRNLGKIILQRTMGSLNVTAAPAMPTLTITGPEFSLTLHDTTGTNLLVPTDTYQVRAESGRWSDATNCLVTASAVVPCNFSPRLGALALTCNQPGTTYQLRDDHDNKVATGNLPATLIGLPVGNYLVVAIHHGTVLTNSGPVVADTTNSLSLEFQLGAVALETMPIGAEVADETGQRLGQTPFTLAGLPPGKRIFTLQKNGYQAIKLALDIAANQTNSVSTNLVSGVYLSAMKLARQHLAATNYDAALAAVKPVLAADPTDADALALQREARGQQAMQTAKLAGARNDYLAGIKALETALQALPDNAEAIGLLTDFKKRAPEQTARENAGRLNRPQTEFDTWMSADTDSGLFESHELKTAKPCKEVQDAIRQTLTGGQPPFKITRDDSPKPELFDFEAEQELMTYMNTSAGKRRCVIVIGQTKDDETKILFKVFEYKTEAVNKFSIGNLIGTPVAVNYVPIHASKVTMTDALNARLAEGVQSINARIQQAIGQP